MVAAKRDVSEKELVLMRVEEIVQRKPNEVTDKALQRSEAGKNLKKFDSIDDLFEDLGM